MSIKNYLIKYLLIRNPSNTNCKAWFLYYISICRLFYLKLSYTSLYDFRKIIVFTQHLRNTVRFPLLYWPNRALSERRGPDRRFSLDEESVSVSTYRFANFEVGEKYCHKINERQSITWGWIHFIETSSGEITCFGDRKSTRLNSSHLARSRMPSSA